MGDQFHVCRCKKHIYSEECDLPGVNLGRHFYKCDDCSYFEFEELAFDLFWPNLVMFHPQYEESVNEAKTKQDQKPKKKKIKRSG